MEIIVCSLTFILLLAVFRIKNKLYKIEQDNNKLLEFIKQIQIDIQTMADSEELTNIKQKIACLQPPFQPEKIVLQSNSNPNTKICFDKAILKLEHLKNYQAISSNQGPMYNGQDIIENLIRSATTPALFRATTSVATLTQLSDGTFSTMVHGKHGQIISHAGFEKAGVSSFVPLGVFQLASFFTGQYYLNTITNMFQEINKKLKELNDFNETEVIGKINASYGELEKLMQNKFYTQEDLTYLLSIKKTAREIMEQYKEMLKRDHCEVPKGICSEILKKLNVRSDQEKIKEIYSYSYFPFAFQVILQTDDIIHWCDLTELYINSRMLADLSRKEKCQMLKNRIFNWKTSDFYLNSEGAAKIESYNKNFQKVCAENQNQLWEDARDIICKPTGRLLNKILRKEQKENVSIEDFKNGMLTTINDLKDYDMTSQKMAAVLIKKWNDKSKHEILLYIDDHSNSYFLVSKKMQIVNGRHVYK